MINGSPPPSVKVELPRIRNETPPPGEPDDVVCTPDARPSICWRNEGAATFVSSDGLITETAPVISFFFWAV